MAITPTQGRPSNSLHFVVGEINGKMDQLLASILPQLQALREADTSLEQRVMVLEAGRWQLIGAGTIIVFLFTSYEVIARVFHF